MTLARPLAPMLIAATLGGCVRFHECPSCGDATNRPDEDVGGLDRGLGEGPGDLFVEAGGPDVPDAALPDTLPADSYPFDGHVPCTDLIANSEVEILFDHGGGTIEELTFKLGSNQNVADGYWNYQHTAGLGRLNKESGTLLVSCQVGPSSATLEYVNGALYGKKTLVLSWSQKGLVIDVTISNLKAANQEWGMWRPGGTNDASDWVRVVKADQTSQDFKLVYPGNFQAIWSGLALGVAVWDDKHDEAFGYRYPAPGRQVQVGNGMSLDGPRQTFPAGGTYSFSFAILHKADLLSWL